MTRHARPVERPMELAPSGAPLRHRIADALIELLRAGRLRPGDTLPATRVLAADLGISRTAVLAAYDELAAAGFIQAWTPGCIWADLPPGTEETELQGRLGRAGLAVDVLGQYATAPLARRALVCGYALLPETQAAAAAEVIAAGVKE